MREELDHILQQIGSTFLTTAEWTAAAGVLDGNEDNVSRFRALKTVLISRGGEDSALQRLTYYFRALGLTPAELELPQEGFSSVFIGAPL